MKSLILRSSFFSALIASALFLYTQMEQRSTQIQSTSTLEFPAELDRFIQQQHSLPRYAEAGYSPLGRSPVVDALLGDPFYIPTYAQTIATRLKEASEGNRIQELASAVFIAGGIPVEMKKLSETISKKTPSSFIEALGTTLGERIYSYWDLFVKVNKEVESIIGSLSEEEKNWLLLNYDAFFFGTEEKSDQYDFFTTESHIPLKFFELASKVDIAKLAECALQLSTIVDDLHAGALEFSLILLQEDFIWEEHGLKLIISAKEHTIHKESADFFIDLGGNNLFYNNAGGTEGIRATALHVDFFGGNIFIGDNFVQGSGFLGIGILASFSGNNIYKANAYSQGCGFIGMGFLINLEGNNQYELNLAGQSFAVFGSSLLWNREGDNQYLATEGMAQAASSTLGVAFLIDNGGYNTYHSGIIGKGGSRYGGIGQGSSTGVRIYPWTSNASFYGGLSFLYVDGDNNAFKTAWLGQGSAYFLSAGILVANGSHNNFYADFDSQGQGLHLSAGLLLQHGGYNNYKGGWGSLGVAGDRSAGMLINTGGYNTYHGTDHSVGTARKPKALAVFIDTEGNNTYIFQKSSNANLQWPQSPNEWPSALFLELGENNRYPENVDTMERGENLRWGVGNKGIGIDTPMKQDNIVEHLFSRFPTSPRVPFPFDPSNGWKNNSAFHALKHHESQDQIKSQVKEILTADYDLRRHLYEEIDLFRFTHPHLKIDLSDLLANPAKIPEDQLNYAVLWAFQNNADAYVDDFVEALTHNQIRSEYARKMAILYVGKFSKSDINPLLKKIMLEDPSIENRYVAAAMLTKHAKDTQSLGLLNEGLNSELEVVRYAIAKGLQDNTHADVLSLIKPLLLDSSFYVRRAAALTAISLHDKAGIPVLLETLQYETLDTGDNYGNNIYNDLASYVGVNFGLDKNAWMAWWEKEKNTFAFPKDN